MQVAKKLVDSDFKHDRVGDPTRISSRQEQHVKKYAKDFFEKVVAQKKAHEEKKAARRGHNGSQGYAAKDSTALSPPGNTTLEDPKDAEHGMDMSDDEGNETKPGSATPSTPALQLANADGSKRKRDENYEVEGTPMEEQATPTKRLKSETPPLPPPPPPTGNIPQQSPSMNGENAAKTSARPAYHDQRGIPSLEAANIANGEGESRKHEKSILRPSPPTTPGPDRTPGDVQDMDDGLAKVRVGQSPDADAVSPDAGFGNEQDEDQEAAFGLKHFPGGAKLSVGGEVR